MTRHRYSRWAVVVALLSIAPLGACSNESKPSGETGQAETATETVAAAVARVPVTISISGLEGALGHYLAGVLYTGSGPPHTEEQVVGGVAAEVTADPFTAELDLRGGEEGLPMWSEECLPGSQPSVPSACALFPYLTDEQQMVAPGTYTLLLWLAPNLIGHYTRWAPNDQDGMVRCRTTLEVGSTGAPVTVTFVRAVDAAGQHCAVE